MLYDKRFEFTCFVCPTESEVVEDLKRARARLDDPAAWCCSGARDGDAVCLLLAITSGVTHREGRFDRALAALRLAINNGRSRYVGIIEWNEARGRTHAEVIDALDRAILIARKWQ